MSDLVKRLREGDHFERVMSAEQAANRIEDMEAKLNWVIVERDETFALMLDRAQTAEAKLAKAVEGFEKLARLGNGDRYGNSDGNVIAQRYIAELTGGKDE